MNKIAANIVKGFLGRVKKREKNKDQSSLKWVQQKIIKHQDDEKIKFVRLDQYIIYYQRPYELLHTYRDLFERELYAFKTTSKSPVIIDCGSNIGLSILVFKKYFPASTVIAFEPDENNYALLQKNMEANKLQNVEVNKSAVWITNGTITFNSKGSEGSHISESDGGIRVPCIKLASLLQQYETIHFLKMDIEGAEYEVIKDCQLQLSKVENLFLEYHGKASETEKLEQIFTILKNAGFSVYIKNAADNLAYPFRQKTTGEVYDVQLNLFCYR